MKTMFGLTGFLLSIAVAAASSGFFCSPPTDTAGPTRADSLRILLSLETVGTQGAIFSGAPIKAILTSLDGFDYNQIRWHWRSNGGAVELNGADTMVRGSVKRAEVMLSWTRMPLDSDTIAHRVYDSVYVSMFGEERRSNAVRVYVTNLSPVFDSLRIGTTSFTGLDTLWQYNVDTIKDLQMGISARDPNAMDILQAEWTAVTGVLLYDPYRSLIAHYRPAPADVWDTVTIRLRDTKGGQVVRTILMAKHLPNRLPILDSVGFNGVLFNDNGLPFVYSQPSLDTVVIRLGVHDPDNDPVTALWSLKRKTGTLAGAVNFVQTYNCTASVYKGVFTDSLQFVDTVKVTLRDIHGGTTQKSLVLLRGSRSLPPVIDSAKVGTQTFRAPDSVFTISRILGDSLKMRVWYRDPDHDDPYMTVTWSMTDAARLQPPSGDSTIYRFRNALASDTVNVRVTDSKQRGPRFRIIITVNNRPPQIDSLSMKWLDTTANPPVASLKYRTFDTIPVMYPPRSGKMALRLYAHDPDPADTLKYQWTSNFPIALAGGPTNTAEVIYATPSGASIDTCRFTITDPKGISVVKRIILNVK